MHLVARGRWYVHNELQLTTQLKKYRTLKQRYYGADTTGHELEPDITALVNAVKQEMHA